jgi:hypothetical protein
VDAIFNALAYITKPNPERTAGTARSREELVKFIDAPGVHIGDLYYIGNIVTALDTLPSGVTPTPSPTPTLTLTPTLSPTPTLTPTPGPSPTSGLPGPNAYTERCDMA